MQSALWLASYGLWLAAAAGPSPQSPAASPEAGAKTTYLVVYRPGPAWIVGQPLSKQSLGEHGRYVLSLYTKGMLRIGGGFLDDTGGAMVFDAESDEEAAAVVAADPAVISKLFVAERHPWRLVDWEKRAKAAAAPSPRP